MKISEGFKRMERQLKAILVIQLISNILMIAAMKNPLVVSFIASIFVAVLLSISIIRAVKAKESSNDLPSKADH